MKPVRAVQTSKKSTFESKKIHPLVKLDFGLLLVLPALKRRLLKKISSVAYWFLVQISTVTAILKLPGIPMLTALTEKIKESKFREDNRVSMKYFLAPETIHCTTGLF